MQKHVFIAAAACRFWHVTALVLGMQYAACVVGSEPCCSQDTSLFGAKSRSSHTWTAAPGESICSFSSRQSSYTNSHPASRVHALQPTTKRYGYHFAKTQLSFHRLPKLEAHSSAPPSFTFVHLPFLLLRQPSISRERPTASQ